MGGHHHILFFCHGLPERQQEITSHSTTIIGPKCDVNNADLHISDAKNTGRFSQNMFYMKPPSFFLIRWPSSLPTNLLGENSTVH